MAERPSIYIVDDDPEALAAMLNALARRFGGDYNVVSHLSPQAALNAIGKMVQEGEELALSIADQRMPEMTGREFLDKVRSVVPGAKRALLVDWGDREVSPTILQACALDDARRGSAKRVAAAVGEGAGAVQNVHQFLEQARGAPVVAVQQRLATEPPVAPLV